MSSEKEDLKAIIGSVHLDQLFLIETAVRKMIKKKQRENRELVWKVIDGDGNIITIFRRAGYLEAAEALLTVAKERFAPNKASSMMELRLIYDWVPASDCGIQA